MLVQYLLELIAQFFLLDFSRSLKRDLGSKNVSVFSLLGKPFL